MEDYKLFDAEYKFMEIIWAYAPINSTELVKTTEAFLGWKKSTTYTVLRKLSERGFIENKDAVVNYIITREQVQKEESRALVDKLFSGSLKMFLAGFLNKEKLTEAEALELKKIIDQSTNKGR